MACHPRATEWTTIIHTHLPPLTKPQAPVWALGSLGMVLARCCALTAVSAFLAMGLHRQEDAVRQQVREFGYEATAKRGPARQALVIETCWVPLWAWVVAPWAGPPVALALAATPWGSRLPVVALRGVSRGWALPVAWSVLAATAPQAWRRAWWRRLRHVRRALPRAWTGLGLADRGLDARWVCRRLPRLGGHPFLRIHTGGTVRPTGHGRGGPLKTVGPEPGPTWQGTGSAFKGRNRQLHWTLRAGGEPGEQEPWVLLTALPPAASTACWYGLRAWMEQGFTLTKRAGWPWQRTRMPQPARAARLGRAVAGAPWGGVSVGGAAEETSPASTVLDVTALVPQPARPRRATRLRLVSVLRRGWPLRLVAWRDQAPLPLGRFVPAPWPAVPVPEAVPPSLPALALPQAA